MSADKIVILGVNHKTAPVEIRERVLEVFPDASISFKPDPALQAIVDSWPADVDDGLARSDWQFFPRHGLDEALSEYLLPALQSRYA